MAQKEGIDISMINLRIPASTKDRPIMVDLIDKWYKGTTLRLLNEVWVATQLFWVSDLVQASIEEVNGDTGGGGICTSEHSTLAPVSSVIIKDGGDMGRYGEICISRYTK